MIAHDSLDRLFEDAERHAAEPLWTVMHAMVPPAPQPRAAPHVWPFAPFRELLHRAGALVSAEQAERRVFMLVNPALEAPHTTDTLYAGLQLIAPGEVARAHRHTSFALRFIIEGERAYTAVGGEKVMMERGDLVLTPSWDYHDHGHEGDAPMIWLDGLDLPLFRFFPTAFAEPYRESRYPSTPAAEETNLRYRWREMQSRLDAVPGAFAMLRYRQRDGDGEISLTLGAAAERIAAGAASPVRRETASAVYHVVSGSGTTDVEDAQGRTVTLRWTQSDTFCLPAWARFRHRADAGETVHLFRFDDRPMLEALRLHRSEDAVGETSAQGAEAEPIAQGRAAPAQTGGRR